MKHWGNPEGLPVRCSFNLERLWREIDYITIKHLNRPESVRALTDYVYGRSLINWLDCL